MSRHPGPGRGGRRGRCAAFALACLCAGCAAAGTPDAGSPAPAPAAVAQPRPAAPAKEPERIAARIKELEAALRNGGAADPDGSRARELALLYTHPANLSPDHERALALMRTSLARAGPAGQDPDAGRLTVLLEAVCRLGQLLRDTKTREKDLAAQAQSLHQREQDLKRREQELSAENQLLRARIEKLKALDLEMEKRRKSAR